MKPSDSYPQRWAGLQNPPPESQKHIEQWQVFLRKDQEGLFTIKVDKLGMTFRFDVRWDELIPMHKKQGEQYCIAGKDVAYFYELNRVEVFKKINASWSKSADCVLIPKEHIAMLVEVLDEYYKIREEVGLGNSKLEPGFLPFMSVIADQEQEKLEDELLKNV